jgi:DNA invertase Pin-like site-specific DNA recombinase
MRAIIYARGRCLSSSKVDGEELLLTELQVDRCRVVAFAHGLEVAAAFRDHGESANNSERPGLRAMLDQIDSGEITTDFVIVTSFDRLSRTTNQMAALIARLHRLNIEVLAAGDEELLNQIMENRDGASVS